MFIPWKAGGCENIGSNFTTSWRWQRCKLIPRPWYRGTWCPTVVPPNSPKSLEITRRTSHPVSKTMFTRNFGKTDGSSTQKWRWMVDYSAFSFMVIFKFCSPFVFEKNTWMFTTDNDKILKVMSPRGKKRYLPTIATLNHLHSLKHLKNEHT